MIAWAAFVIACVAFACVVALLALVSFLVRKARPYLAMLGLGGDAFGNPGSGEQ